jgi:hypothetical protein
MKIFQIYKLIQKGIIMAEGFINNCNSINDLIEKRSMMLDLLTMFYQRTQIYLITENQKELFEDFIWGLCGDYDTEISHQQNMSRILENVYD